MTARLAPAAGHLVTPAMLDAVPAAARRYLDWAGVVGQVVPATLTLRQVGELRTAAGRPWRAFTAEEDFVTAPPGFSWRATVRLAGFPLLRARDSYLDGRGWMQIRAGAVIPAGSVRGTAMNEAALLRYLSEMVWFPGAFLLGNIAWRPLNGHTVQVSIADAGLAATGTLHVGNEGQPCEFTATRHRHLGGGFKPTPWIATYTNYGELRGVRVPTAGWAEYRLPSGPVPYIHLRIQP